MLPSRLLPRLAGLGIAAALALGIPPVRAQSDATFSGVRALNLARNRAVKLNGGLGIYRPAACMFSTEWGGSGCLVRRDAEGFLFRFLGGPPGWEQLGKPANRETEILISPDGRSVVEVRYNGAPRGQGQAAPAPAEKIPDIPAPPTQ
ncbi:MAG: hypothetical protein VKI81_01975 [Synechococcaceae cyanobacterium]|nr:hypothetical protein [Synechococcaceae cyanobacterium]